MARGKLKSKRCLTKKCVKKMNAKAKTFTMKKGGKTSSLDIEGRLYKEGKGKYSDLEESDFCGPAGNAPMGTFPVDTEKRCSAALSYARNAPYPDGIVDCAMKKAKQNGWKCGQGSKQVKKLKSKKSKKSKKNKKSKKGGWVGATLGSVVGTAVGYTLGANYPPSILKNKESSDSVSDNDSFSESTDEFNDGINPTKETTPVPTKDVSTPLSGGKKKTKGKGKKTKGKGKKTKGKGKKGKKSAYSQFLSKELRRVGDANPDWPQPKVFKEAVSNCSKSK